MTQISPGIAERIIEARAKAGMSQLELAAAAEIAPAQISRYEAGKVLPRIGVAYRLAEALAVDLQWLCEGAKPADEGPAEAERLEPSALAPALARMEALVTQRERELRDAVRLIAPVILEATKGLDEKQPMPGDRFGQPVGHWRSVFEPAADGLDPSALKSSDQLSLAITWTRLMLAAKGLDS